MPVINILDAQLAELIAAGEVVERPASVVKELTENSIDAGARRISVEIKGGGVAYIKITDDGCGIPFDEVERAFVRHATSKVLTQEDLSRIGTLGFRGEALPSIASMSRVQLTTRTKEQPLGARFSIAGGEAGEKQEVGCPVGTTVLVEHLFFNTPARLKFLRRDATEAASVTAVLERAALSHPEIAFRFVRDGQLRFSTPGNGDLLSAIHAVYGDDFASGLFPVEAGGPISVRGYLQTPEKCRGSRSMQLFFVNGRPVQSGVCTAALEAAYKNALPTGRFPACCLFLSLDLSEVDVNVHPAKTQVRFTEEREVFEALYAACRSALREANDRLQGASAVRPRLTPFDLTDFDHSQRQQGFALDSPLSPPPLGEAAILRSPGAAVYIRPRSAAALFDIERDEPAGPSGVEKAAQYTEPTMPTAHKTPIDGQTLSPWPAAEALSAPSQSADQPPCAPSSFVAEAAQAAAAAPGDPHIEAAGREGPVAPAAESGLPIVDPESAPPVCPEIRVLGELFCTYIVAQWGESLLLIDKHAAHERLNYNALVENTAAPQSQLLLTPLSIPLPAEQYAAALEGADIFSSMGFLLEEFGGGTLLLREIPLILPVEQARLAVLELAERLSAKDYCASVSQIDRLYYSVACRASVMAGQPGKLGELVALTERMLEGGDVSHCPHGRPVYRLLTRGELGRLFLREEGQ